MKMMKISMAAAAACLLTTSAYALKTEDRVLKGNMQVEYTKVPGDVNSIQEMLSKGEFYGRLRSNAFWWDWDNENHGAKPTDDQNMWGLGGSMIYKTGFFRGVAATVGYYGTTNMVSESTVGTTNVGKAGKDTYHTRADGSEGGIGVLAEGYLEYKAGKTDAKVGRQIIESTLLASNDTKMIPNTFEAAVVENKDIADTKLRLGYITQQKLRDHQNFHSILAYQKRDENDDSAGHAGLSLANIAAAGADANPDMIFVTAENKSLKGLKLNGDYYNINGYFSTVVAEANYQIALGSDWKLTPGVRYLKQMDDGAGAIGGPSLTGKITAGKGYSNINSVDASMWAARLVLENGPLSMMAGYSAVADNADIIAPWRGFPTGGYTRSMAQYNWMSNTKTWMLQTSYDFNKAGLVPGLKLSADYADMNYDDAKILAKTVAYTDRTIFHVDAIQSFKAIPNAEFKLRFATVNADKKPADTKDYDSYNEYRFEMNYLF
ncbi:MAG: OprD family outer membrane porin [Sulfuricurvum sp.]|uniref:OprD family outer membrane porin n=1 Tax=Sulfuricurvum sp. TaxID=2025608 RepID=UPI00261B66C0|nr:OprD family outer membrane porin [Sulfuricurvum sp.]MDD2369036.1 OprD family outer membrane porin [Sulfuricurvum sp.]MDD2951061.1 OprD family outer membrane porin [Sulfuricurvum sp.]MDD5118279.1 OprD family outer membrane porin [Sulfuricurvum sp.]